MPLCSLLYVSESTLDPGEAEKAVCEIVSAATTANCGFDITGALIFTGQHFAQLLEGEPGQVDALMESINRDARHRNVKVVNRTDIEEREFDLWAMAYSGPSYFVSRHIKPLLYPPKSTGQGDTATQLKDLMAEFLRMKGNAAA